MNYKVGSPETHNERLFKEKNHNEFDRMAQCRACGRLFMRVNRDDICEDCAKIKA